MYGELTMIFSFDTDNIVPIVGTYSYLIAPLSGIAVFFIMSFKQHLMRTQAIKRIMYEAEQTRYEWKRFRKKVESISSEIERLKENKGSVHPRNMILKSELIGLPEISSRQAADYIQRLTLKGIKIKGREITKSQASILVLVAGAHFCPIAYYEKHLLKKDSGFTAQEVSIVDIPVDFAKQEPQYSPGLMQEVDVNKDPFLMSDLELTSVIKNASKETEG